MLSTVWYSWGAGKDNAFAFPSRMGCEYCSDDFGTMKDRLVSAFTVSWFIARNIYLVFVPFSGNCVHVSHSVMPDSLQPYGLQPTRLLRHGVLQARILEWVAMPSSRGSSWLRDRTWISCISCTGMHLLYQWHYLGSPELLKYWNFVNDESS